MAHPLICCGVDAVRLCRTGGGLRVYGGHGVVRSITRGDETHSPGAECFGGDALYAEVLSRRLFLYRAIFWPFAVTSVPAAFIGGTLSVSSSLYNIIVGGVLLYAALQLFRVTQVAPSMGIRPPPLWLALIAGAGVGLLSGVTGIGGGIMVGPLLLSMRWAETRQTLGISAAINLTNSTAGTLGHLSSVMALPSAIPLWAAAAMLGG